MKIGIYQSYWGPVGGGQRYIAVLAEFLARQHEVEIIHHHENFDASKIEEPMGVDLSGVTFRETAPLTRNTLGSTLFFGNLAAEKEHGRELSENYDLFIDSSDSVPFFNHARKGLLITHFPLISFKQFHGQESDAWKTTPSWKKAIKNKAHRYEWKKRMASYDLCVTNSRFTKSWIRKYWNLNAEIAYPPLRVGLKSKSKTPTILSIGAFKSEQHKKQAVLIDCFKQLCDSGLADWTYRLIGSVGKTNEDRNYLDHLQEISQGYPIEICPNASGAELKDALETSSLLWHSMGYGVDAERDPKRMEHFGMVATEAMSAGCVPIAFNGGGLKETITHQESGYLWSSLDELAKATREIANDQSMLERMSMAAIDRAQLFSQSVFENTYSKIIKSLG